MLSGIDCVLGQRGVLGADCPGLALQLDVVNLHIL